MKVAIDLLTLTLAFTGHANRDGTMTEEQKHEYLKQFEGNLVFPAEVALWKRGAFKQGYHYLDCAKAFALTGNEFAEACLELPPQ